MNSSSLPLEMLAAQLRKPEGELGLKVAENMNTGNARMNLHAIEQLRIKDNDNILEIGMGNGRFVPEVLKLANNLRYTGYDFSQEMISEAATRNSEFVIGGQARFVLGDAASMPFESDHFDSVFTVNTIYFWSEPEKELAEIARILRPDGKFVIAIRSEDAMRQLSFTQFGFTKYSLTKLLTLLNKCGFVLDHCVEELEPTTEVMGRKVTLDHIIVRAGIK